MKNYKANGTENGLCTSIHKEETEVNIDKILAIERFSRKRHLRIYDFEQAAMWEAESQAQQQLKVYKETSEKTQDS